MTTLQYVSRPYQWSHATSDGFVLDVDNHLVKARGRDRELVSWCGGTFGRLPDGDVSEMSSVDFARICSRCLEALKDATGFVPKYEGKEWRSV